MKIGVMGGSGLYQLEGLEEVERISLETPFGNPSDQFVKGKLSGVEVFFLPRHGASHQYPPHQVNYKANILAFKKLGIELLISVSAVGSLKENIHPGDVVLVDQMIDRTRTRPNTFFEDVGVVAHVGFAEPTDKIARTHFFKATKRLGYRVHPTGIYVCIEGPQFSTRAESELYRTWGADVIGMTNLPEARLAREAEMPYVTLALVTDYDCWHQIEESVNVEDVLKVLRENVVRAKRILEKSIPILPHFENSPANSALQNSVLCPWDQIPSLAEEKLGIILKKYLKK